MVVSPSVECKELNVCFQEWKENSGKMEKDLKKKLIKTGKAIGRNMP
jgi:hypothetical protein